MRNVSPHPALRHWWQSRPFFGLAGGWGFIIAAGGGLYAGLHHLRLA